MRDRETIDSELRLIALARRSIREQGGQPSCREVDELLDERLAYRAGVVEASSETAAVEARATEVGADTHTQCDETDDITRNGCKGLLRRFASLAVLPLSLAATAAVWAAPFAVHHADSEAQPTVALPPAESFNPVAQPTAVPPPAEPSIPVAQPTAVPPPAEPSIPVAPKPPVPPRHIRDRAFIDGPKPYDPASPAEIQQALQNALSDLKAIPGLQGIAGLQGLLGLQGIPDLQGIPGQ